MFDQDENPKNDEPDNGESNKGESNSEEALLESLDDIFEESLEELEKLSKEVKEIPAQLYLLPISQRPLFPGMTAPILIQPGPFYEVLKLVIKSDHKSLGLFLTKEEGMDVRKAEYEDLHSVGVLARVTRILPVEQGGAQVILNIEDRVILDKPVVGSKYLRAKVHSQKEEIALSNELKAHAMTIIATIKELLKLNPLFKEELQVFLSHSDFTEPGRLADFAVALTTASREELQDILETFDTQSRIDKALVVLKKELDLSRLQNSIHQKIEATITKSQKDFFLKEQLKTIKKELGIEKDEKSCDREKFEARLKDRKLPPHIEKTIKEEMDKFSVLDIHSSEYGVCRGYLDWLTVVPWGIFSEECYDLRHAESILNEDHYGLEDIKQRILEIISVGKLSGTIRGNIICLVGPPGVGKTSIGKSIARALNRKFYRFSVGGMRDDAEIKGHRRTYIGAMPGKLIQALKYCQTMNPVIMLDEVDKMGSSFQGDPASALLEVLDPEQNSEFLDHYLDVRCNLSDILFIVTANVLDTIPDPLKDRMEILRLSGYISEEKIEISKNYLIPKNRKEMGLKSSQVSFTVEALRDIINGYAREAGVRGLENQIKKILRKLATKIVREEEKHQLEEEEQKKVEAEKKPGKKTKDKIFKKSKNSKISFKINPNNLKEYLGKPIFNSDRFYERTPVGVSMGLAWTAMGGATLYVEAVKVAAEKTGMKLTGQAGNVMKESSEIAWSYLRKTFSQYAPGKSFFKDCEVHIHIPEGATPKDGPSAGITMAIAILSLLKNEPVLDNLGMTGELTLTGKVLAIGGVKEKVVAARRSGVTTLIFPKDNIRDYDELPSHIKQGMSVHFVDYFNEVVAIAFKKNR